MQFPHMLRTWRGSWVMTWMFHTSAYVWKCDAFHLQKVVVRFCLFCAKLSVYAFNYPRSVSHAVACLVLLTGEVFTKLEY